MVLWSHRETKTVAGTASDGERVKLARARLAREIFDGRYLQGESVQLAEIAAKYQLDGDSVLTVFAELQTLGMVTLSGQSSAIVHSSNSKEMQEAYEVRAALEEIAGRAAAKALKGNTAALQCELDAMRIAVRNLNLNSCAEHDARFHRPDAGLRAVPGER